MKVYNKTSKKAEKKIAKSIRKNFSRYKKGIVACIIFSIFFVIVFIKNAAIIVRELDNNLYGEELFVSILLILGLCLFPILGCIISYSIAISGGRDILLTRLNEQIIFLEEEFKIQYTPRYRKVENGEYVEKTIPYNKIQSVVYDNKMQRIEITTDYTYKLWKWLRFGEMEDNIVFKEYQNSTIIIYNCFENMQDLVSELQRITGKQIENK